MRLSFRRVLLGFTVFLLTVSVGVMGYTITGASFLDSLYMVVVTIFSVGYEEEVAVDTPAKKVFTMLVILAGCSSLLYVVGGFIQMATEGEINRALGAQRMTRGIDKLKGHSIICGFGRMGQIMAKELRESGHNFVVIDCDEERVLEAEGLNYLAMVGDATSEELLEKARVKEASSLATVLPSDAMNVFITLSARNFNPDLNILARGELPSTEAKLMQAGANHVVLPAAIGGLRMAHMIVRPSASHLIDTLEHATMINDDLEQLGVQLSEVKMAPDSPCVDKSVSEIEIVGEGAYLIVAIRRQDGSLLRQPEGDAVIREDDTVILIGHGDAQPHFTLEKTSAREVSYHRTSDDSEKSGS